MASRRQESKLASHHVAMHMAVLRVMMGVATGWTIRAVLKQDRSRIALF